MKNIIILLVAYFLQGCGIFASNPFPSNRYILDKEAVKFSETVPEISFSNLPPQEKRIGQEFPRTHIIVSSSGGGARAAAFTLGVLSELQDNIVGKDSNLLNEVDYFSTVSGGGWGVASYLSNSVIKGAPYDLGDSNNIEIINQYAKYEELRDKIFDCHSNSLSTITNNVKLKDIYSEGQTEPLFPYILPNITVSANQSPFVITKEFVEHYKINKFSSESCEEKYSINLNDIDKSIGDIPLSYAIGLSSSVPGFYLGRAETDICLQSEMKSSYFCEQGKHKYTNLTLVDGGVYDNYGVFSALEILNSKPPNEKKILIIIDANADATIPFENSESSNFDTAYDTGLALGFPSRTAFFQRYFTKVADVLGIEVIYIGFNTLFLSDNQSQSRYSLNNLSSSYPELVEAANNRICYDDKTGQSLKPGNLLRLESKDCSNNNLFRAAINNKTTYAFGEEMFKRMYQLGQVATEINLEKNTSKEVLSLF
ncbi:patatin-like phospholipase family protein [Shewanella sp. 4_MG-2023]|uniref:patatin-like phospholipase family protein n=1 Tax=Shewanella sp. 4_MG-2023 TaxID=3062652 RepID=UPI0026E18493|nr:patatin-like phospholipase family protein [Shewanella sp. 4_MG-2023]MDO6680212.1 patatin-like phospholipase family protein [Shewanella sp. 4_MG-2023]